MTMKMPKKKTLGPHRPPGAKKVFIVEDHPVFREGLANLVREETDLKLSGTAADAFAARRDIARLKPDLVLVDISMPGQSGLELIKAIRAKDTKLKILVVSMHDEALYANRVLRLGADGYIMKKEEPSEILNAIRDILDGHIYLSEAVLASTDKSAVSAQPPPKLRPLDLLTDTELEILELLGMGKTDEEITAQLHSSDSQVKAAREAIKSKLKLRNDNTLIRFAVCWVETGSTEPT
jgi:DNA-binding NarL/FixJ family response regulator